MIAKPFELAAVDHFVDILTKSLDKDNLAISTLVGFRAPCNKVLADDKYIQVRADEDGENCRVGILGIINAFLLKTGSERLLASIHDEDGKIIGFSSIVLGD